MSRFLLRSVLVVGVVAVVLGVVAASGDARAENGSAFGGPWISIEYPANPYDQASQGAFLLVNTYHHGTPMNYTVTGRAEGVIGGERRSMPLELRRTSRAGASAVHKQWSDDGTWVLVLTTGQSRGSAATAVVEIGRDGAIASVQVPTERVGAGVGRATRPVTDAEIDALLARRVAAK
ncbi:MAG TPA: hypothetical protein VMM18_05920 [Gemmatimonadaceae bacterium]|nr:hypothetical protein [Gemmatimonadaceae bacterium]